MQSNDSQNKSTSKDTVGPQERKRMDLETAISKLVWARDEELPHILVDARTRRVVSGSTEIAGTGTGGLKVVIREPMTIHFIQPSGEASFMHMVGVLFI